MASDSAPSLLVLPNLCLLAVLQILAADGNCSLFSAARAHSRLHQAAVLALCSITGKLTQQQQMDGVLQYLSKHGQHVDSIAIEGSDDGALTLRQLPSNLQLSSLQLAGLDVQLAQGDDFPAAISRQAPWLARPTCSTCSCSPAACLVGRCCPSFSPCSS
jgi:hypothetical protein